MDSPDNEYLEYSAGSAAIRLLSLTMEKEEIHQKSASMTIGMITAMVQQQSPPIKSALDNDTSSLDSEVPVTT